MPGSSDGTGGPGPPFAQPSRTVVADLPGAPRPGGVATASAWVRRHAIFLTLLLAGAALRVVVERSFDFALEPTEGASPMWRSLVDVQHLLGPATGAAVYVVLLRWGVARWLAALATVPVLVDAHWLANEHMAAPDTWFVFAIALILLLLCRPARDPGRTRRDQVTGALVILVGVSLPVVSYVAWQHRVQDAAGPGPEVEQHAPGTFERMTEWTRSELGSRDDIDRWQFSSYLPGAEASSRTSWDGAGALVTYQDVGYVPGPVLLVGLLLALLAVAGLGRARDSGMRTACLALVTAPVGVWIGAAAGDPSWRHQIAGLVFLPAAGVLGLTALSRGRRSASAGLPQVDHVDRAALADFRERYGSPVLGPVVIVVAAYNEVAGLPAVLTRLPATVCGLDADVVVVDDGSTDGTKAAVRGRAYSVHCSRNRGQGAALRLGYRVARDHGARYIITTDADGQYDDADLPVVLAPILAGSADFVTGSRRLGRQHAEDRLRRTGVYVFAWLVSALIGHRVTDTSFGLRAMRAEVTASVTLNQPQYQSTELLIGAYSHGYRIAEVPGTMHERTAGTTKKGGNLVYGVRYARAVLGTWWREGCPTPVTEHVPGPVRRPSPASRAQVR